MSINRFKSEITDHILKILHSDRPDVQEVKKDEKPFDLSIPSINLAFIFYDLYSFSNKNQDLSHFTYTNTVAQQQNYHLIRIWEDIFYSKKDLVHSRLLSLFGITKKIHGRQCEITDINNKQLLDFLNDNHLNVPIKGKHKYALTYKNSIVAVMSFSKGVIFERSGIPFRSYEMLRFCNKINTTVTGGMGKLLNHFIKEIQPDDIMSYADRDWSEGNAYRRNGFSLVSETPPQYFWLAPDNPERIYPGRILYHINDFKARDQAEEDAFMTQRGFIKVYNSGSLKFLKMLNPK